MILEIMFPEFCTMYADSINGRYLWTQISSME